MTKDILNFTEKLDQNSCTYIATLTLNEFKDKFYTDEWKTEKKEKKKKENVKCYFNQVKGFCLKHIDNSINKVHYKYAKGRDNGRIYTVGFGIQGLYKNLRYLLTPEGYNDYDIVNCHPSILLKECKRLDIKCPFLQEYVSNRDTVLSENKLTKLQVLYYINTDKNPIKKNYTPWLIGFITELKQIKAEIYDLVKYTETNPDNPISSAMNKRLCEIENDILQRTIKQFGLKDRYLTPMFDGFLTDAHLNIEELNKFTEKDGVKWAKKDWVKSHPPGDFDPTKLNTYENAKRQMEEHCFMVRNPVMFCVDDMFRTEADFKTLTATYKYIDADGHERAIYGRWVGDPSKRCYNEVVNMPYNPLQEDPAPEGTYNTAKPFAFSYLPESERIDALKDYRHIIYHLTQSEEELDYVVKYTAHILQKPLENPQIILVIKGHMEGAGKDTIVKTLTKVLGKNYTYSTSEMNDVFGTYNSGVANKLIVQFNEAQSSQGVKFNDKIKDFVTADTIEIKEKYMKSVYQKNNVRPIVNSNNHTPILGGRRPMICQTRTAEIITKEWWEDYYNNKMTNKDWINSLGSQLLDIDLSDFKVGKIPKTETNQDKLNKKIMPIHDLFRDMADGHLLNKIRKINDKTKYEPDKIDGLFEIKNSNEIGIKRKWLLAEWKKYYEDEYHIQFIDTKKAKDQISNWIAEYSEAIKYCENGKYKKEEIGGKKKQVKKIYVMNPETMLTCLKNGGRYRERDNDM